MISNALYDRLKWVAQIGLPGLGTFYAAMDQIWGLSNGDEIVASVMAADALLGLYLGLSTNMYKNSDAATQGYLRQVGVDPDTGMPHLAATFTELPQDLLNRESITLKVGEGPVNQPPPMEEH